MATETSREERGRAIFEKPGQIERIDGTHYEVKSQSGTGFYEVVFGSPAGWKCSCPDYVNRAVKCKHVWSVELSAGIRKVVEVVEEQRERTVTIEPVNVSACRFCSSANIVRDGVRHNKAGNIQVYSCRDCKRYFSFNLGFEKMKASPQAITGAMQLYFSGESLRNVQKFLTLQGVSISHVAIYKWISKYVRLMEEYLFLMKPNLGDTWRADELYLKVKGNTKYLYALMDDQTRFWIAQQVAGTKGTADVTTLFRQGRVAAGKTPRTLITDGAPNFGIGIKDSWTSMKEARPVHISKVKFDGAHSNNKIERLNGEIRDREKVMRGIKNAEGPILTGYRLYHNYLRPHEALNGRTPAEAAGVQVLGPNKWITLIQNAKLDQIHPTGVNGFPHPSKS